MLILYLATLAGIWMLFRLVSQLIDRIHLKEFDHQLGAILGFAKGLLLCLVVTFFAATLSESARQSILHSPSGYYMAKLVHNAGPLLPREVRDLLGKYVAELDRKLDPATPPDKPLGDRLQDRLPDGIPGPLREELKRGVEGTFSGADHSWQAGLQQPASAQPSQPVPWGGWSDRGQPAAPSDPFLASAPVEPLRRPVWQDRFRPFALRAGVVAGATGASPLAAAATPAVSAGTGLSKLARRRCGRAGLGPADPRISRRKTAV